MNISGKVRIRVTMKRAEQIIRQSHEIHATDQSQPPFACAAVTYLSKNLLCRYPDAVSYRQEPAAFHL